MSGRLLPHALLDLTLARASARLECLAYKSLQSHAGRVIRRYAHQQALLQDHPPAPTEYLPYDTASDRSLYAKRDPSRTERTALSSGGLFPHSQDGPLTELEKRILELKELPVSEIAQTSEPAYSESELLSIYEELLAIPSRPHTQGAAMVDPESRQRQDEAILRSAVKDLYELEDPVSIPIDTRSQYSAAITKLKEIVGALETASSSSTGPAPSISVLPEQEWAALVRTCVREKDAAAAEAVIDLMKRSGSHVPDVLLSTTMSLYADRGDIANTERFLTTFAGSKPSDPLRDLHIKAHLRSVAPRTFPTSALTVLHDYEGRGLPAPQKTYTRVITSLLQTRSTMGEAQAWDLFAHMRYVAHPNPDSRLYAVMIAACASRVLDSQPARALDLWTEMTVDKGMAPTADAYTAVIYACACSGEKLYVNEAFRLAKEMLDGHRDAYGNSAFRPDRKTFYALLEGAKRIGDLAKVRWILAEIVSESMQAARGDASDLVYVDEEIMTHIFHAYAAYKPPFDRAATVLVDESKADASTSDGSSTTTPTSDDPPQAQVQSAAADAPSNPQVPVAPRKPQFTDILPQSRPEVLGETRTLFYKVLQDVAPAALQSSTLFPERMENPMPEAFENVKLSQRLLNAYLSVHYAHGRFDEGVQLYRALFSELGVDKNAWTYVEALERCGRAQRGFERKEALQFAREVWAEWQPGEDAWRRRMKCPVGMNARMIERAYAAMIRILSLTGNACEAVQLVRDFVARYPPHVVKHANPKPALRSMRVSLEAPRPLVRLFTPVEVPDDTVPPLLSFPEVEILHHRLVMIGDTANIRYLKWVCMSYAGALKRRKEATLRAEPVPMDVKQGDHSQKLKQ
ncbi:hypothetical protein C8Q73DRAFT_745662 [Cubamyces lactineus]|nr:hypothetical protein C8Q73DRAFT_745662 [Cubamyces lactineus]